MKFIEGGKIAIARVTEEKTQYEAEMENEREVERVTSVLLMKSVGRAISLSKGPGFEVCEGICGGK